MSGLARLRGRLLMLASAVTVLIGAPSALAVPFCTQTPITIPESGAATPYPVTVVVSGLSGTVTDVNATVNGLTHTFPSDLDILLVGPVAGQSVVLLSDVGGDTNISNLNVTLDDEAASVASSPLGPGPYRPTNIAFGGTDTWPAPAPAGPYGAALSVFDGGNPNGIWSLYIFDDTILDAGSASGFCVDIQTTTTAVRMAGLSAARVRGGLAVTWRTASEVDTLGFHVYRQVGVKRVRVNTRLISAKGRGSYSFLDRKAPKAKAVRYWVQVVNLDGSRTWYGPARVTKRA